jgi:hypothetical protein
MKQLKLCILLLSLYAHAYNQVDCIIFSYDRPLQLYALLESIAIHVDGLQDIFVIYRSSNPVFESGYKKVKQDFSAVHYMCQGNNPAKDFKQLTVKAFQQNNTKYVLFAVDDIVVKEDVDLNDVILRMDRHNAYGFYLRLGLHLDYCYALDTKMMVPKVQAFDGAYTWYFNAATGDWGYPHTVDMTVYRKKDIAESILHMSYENPNLLEARWGGRAGQIMHRCGLCYETTKIVNLPLNRVGHTFANRHMHYMTAQELLDIFLSGKKMNIAPLFGINNKSAHMEYEPTFVER